MDSFLKINPLSEKELFFPGRCVVKHDHWSHQEMIDQRYTWNCSVKKNVNHLPILQNDWSSIDHYKTFWESLSNVLRITI